MVSPYGGHMTESTEVKWGKLRVAVQTLDNGSHWEDATKSRGFWCMRCPEGTRVFWGGGPEETLREGDEEVVYLRVVLSPPKAVFPSWVEKSCIEFPK